MVRAAPDAGGGLYLHRRVSRIWPLALLFLIIAGQATAHPYTVDDLLKLESLGRTAIDPSGRWLIIETRAPYDSAQRFDYDGHTEFPLGRLMLVDLAHPGPARPLQPQETGAGCLAGPFSPRGETMVLSCQRGRTWEAGVVTLASGTVRWLGLTAEIAALGRSMQWRSERELVLISLSPGELPMALRVGRQAMDRLPALWAKSAAGAQSAFSVVGSGRYRDDRPALAPKRLLRIDVVSGRVVELARGDFLDLELSSSGARLAVVAAKEPLQPDASEEVRTADSDRRRDLIIINLETGRSLHPLPSKDVLWSLLNWSPRGDELLVFARSPRTSWMSGALMRVGDDGRAVKVPGAQDLQAEIAWTEDQSHTTVRAGWLGATPVLYARPTASRGRGRADWYALSDFKPANLSNSRAVRAPSARALAPSLTRTSGSAPRSSQGSSLAIGLRGLINPPEGDFAWTPGKWGLRFESPVGTATPPHFPAPSSGSRILAIGARGLVYDQITDHGVETLSLLTPKGLAIRLLELNAPLADVDVSVPRPIAHLGVNGEHLQSWLYLPVGHQRGRPLPLIVLPYPGAVYAAAPYLGRPEALALSNSPQVLAGRGYAVLIPSLPRAAGSKDPASGFTQQILEVVDLAIAQGFADPSRLALWGHSFGGYGAMVTAASTSRFAAIVAANGVSDLVSVRGAFAPFNRLAPEDGLSTTLLAGWAETGQAGLESAPWTDPDRYVRNSPLFAAGRITTPLLLIHGDMDFVSLTQSEEMFSALWRQNKDARLMTFWGEGHVIAGPANVRALYAEVFRFLDPLIGDTRASSAVTPAP